MTGTFNIPFTFVSASHHYFDYNSRLFPLRIVPPLFAFNSSDKIRSQFKYWSENSRVFPKSHEVGRTVRFIVQVNVSQPFYSNSHNFCVLSGRTIVFLVLFLQAHFVLNLLEVNKILLLLSYVLCGKFLAWNNNMCLVQNEPL